MYFILEVAKFKTLQLKFLGSNPHLITKSLFAFNKLIHHSTPHLAHL